MLLVLIISFFIFLILGFPVAFVMGASVFIALLYQQDIPIMLINQRFFTTLDSFPIMAIPFYVFAGELMGRGGISSRLIQLASALVGHIKGGLCHAMVVASMIFSGISGSAAADASAIGSILIPSMLKKKYEKGFITSLQASAATIGPIIPPSILMIIYGSITGVSIAGLFLAGFIPGILMGLALMVIVYFISRRLGYGGEPKQSFRVILEAFFDSLPALGVPVLIIGGIFSGIFTATEAGVVAAVYAIIVARFLYKTINFKDLWEIIESSIITTGMIMFILGMAASFGWILACQEFPSMLVNFIRSLTDNPSIVMLVIIAALLFLGLFLEVLAATIILIPVLDPLGQQFGFDPIHFAIVILIALVIGAITPPVGVLLYITMAIAKAKLEETLKYIFPFVFALIVIILILAYVPDIVLILPKIAMPKMFSPG